ERGAMRRLDLAQRAPVEKLASAAAAGEQYARLLEGLADRRDAQRAVFGSEVGARAARREGRLRVRGVDLAARKHERAADEVDLAVALDHQHLEAARAVPQQERGGGGARDGGLRHPRKMAARAWHVEVHRPAPG